MRRSPTLRVRCLAVAICLVWSQQAWADGGTLRIAQETHGYRFTVFTAPAVIRVGLIDTSVLVQDAETGEPLGDARVSVRMTSRTDPSQSIDATASHDVATNKLLQAALLTLPSAGWWDVVVEVAGPHGPAQASFEIEAAEPLPEWLLLWPWFSWPAAVVVLFGAQQLLGNRRSD
jgi:hypothetical protein